MIVLQGPAGLSIEWLRRQRWFASKERTLAAVGVADTAPLPAAPGLPAAALAVIEVRFAEGDDERYLVPSRVDRDGSLGEPRRGDGVWGRVARVIEDGTNVDGTGGRFECRPTTALRELRATASFEDGLFTERPLEVEQSNTSVVLGERLIYKSYRRLDDGINPEVEIGEYLARRRFPHVPALAGSMIYRQSGRSPTGAGIMHAFVPSRDAWAIVCEALAAGAREQLLAHAAALGTVTGELHAALAEDGRDEAFPVRRATAAERAAWEASAERQLSGALAVLRDPERAWLERLASEIRERFRALGIAGPPAAVTRVHGDYHLGQALHGEHGFVLIDFEGEPARPLVERRAPQSPLKDVAGMLRSFDYAAGAVERAVGDADRLAWWREDGRSAFLSAYRDVPARRGAAMVIDHELLAAFELEKACYEVRYEAGRRPDWVPLPLAGIGRLLGGREVGGAS